MPRKPGAEPWTAATMAQSKTGNDLPSLRCWSGPRVRGDDGASWLNRCKSIDCFEPSIQRACDALSWRAVTWCGDVAAPASAKSVILSRSDRECRLPPCACGRFRVRQSSSASEAAAGMRCRGRGSGAATGTAIWQWCRRCVTAASLSRMHPCGPGKGNQPTLSCGYRISAPRDRARRP